MKITCQTPSKNSDCKIQITVKKNCNLVNVFSRTTLQPFISRLPSYLRGWDGYFECDFYKNMKDAFNEGLPYITHFVVLHPFLRRPQILLTFTTQLTLIKSNLRKKLAFSLEYSSNNSILLVYIANCSGYLPYMLTLSFFIVITLNMVCVYLLL